MNRTYQLPRGFIHRLLFVVVAWLPVWSYADDCLDVFPAAENANTSFSLTPLVSGGPDINVNNGYTLNLAGGQDHSYSSIDANNGFTINVTGAGTARLHIDGDFTLNNGASINAGGVPEDLVIYVGGNIDIRNGAIINALIWAAGSIEIDNGGTTTGALSAAGNITLGSHASSYDAGAISNADFAGMCTLPSGGTVDHYSISHDGTGISCLSEVITIDVHDTSHAGVSIDGVTINLTTSTGKGDWVAIQSGGGTLNNGAAGDGAASYSFASNSSQVQLLFNYTDLGGANSETFSINVSDGANSETSGVATAALDDPDLTFSLAGFEFSNIDTQISAKDSVSAVTLRAVRSSDSDPGVCDTLFANQTLAIELGAECRDPVSCVVASPLSVNGTNIQTNDDNAAVETSSYTSLNLTFDAAGDSSLTLNYPEAGLIQLHARYNIPLDDGGGTPSGDFIRGSSNDFIVKPVGFCIASPTANSDCVAGDASCSAFVEAGSDFVLDVTAVAWQSDSDADFCIGNSPTTNFVDSNITLSANLVAPDPGAAGILGTTSATIASAGAVSINNQSIDEVGVFTITASTNSYLSTETVEATSANIGRFYPDHFVATLIMLTNRMAAACMSASSYTYMNEVFGLDLNITAMNAAATSAITENYIGAFVRLNTVAELGLVATQAGSDLTARLDSSGNTPPVWAAGSANWELELMLQRDTSVDGPFVDMRLGVDPLEADAGDDGVGVLVVAKNLDIDGDTIDDAVDLEGTDIRYGRVQMKNAFGSEFRDLDVPFVTQYYNTPTSRFIDNADDSCTAYQLSDFTEVPGSYTQLLDDPDTTPTAIAGSPYSAGGGHVTMTAPGQNNYGSVDIEFVVPDYLRFDWDNNVATADTNPLSTATFGTYRGNDRIIYRRELSR